MAADANTKINPVRVIISRLPKKIAPFVSSQFPPAVVRKNCRDWLEAGIGNVVDAGVAQVAYAGLRHSTLFWRLMEITSKCDAHKFTLAADTLGRLMSFGEIVSGACSISNKSNTRVKYTRVYFTVVQN